MRESTYRPTLLFPFAMTLLLLTASCIRAPTQTDFMRQTGATNMTTTQLRVQVRGFLDEYTGTVLDAADEIIEKTDDPRIRRDALLWKANSIPAAQKAVFQYDPLAAFVDIWALCLQQERYFTRGAGRDQFGSWQPIVVDASRSLLEEVVVLARDLKTDADISHAKEEVEKWVDDNPIETLTFTRTSPQPVLVRLLGPTARGTSALIGNLNDSVTDLSERLAIYGSTMPDQARWQAELVIDDVMRSGDVQLALNNTSSLADSLERTAVGLEELPDEVTDQVVSSLGVLEREVALLTRFVEQQRIATQQFMREERIAVVQAAQHERQVALERIAEERIDTLDRLDALAEGAMDRATEDLREVIDHTIWQAAKMLAGLMIIFGILGIVALRVLGVGRPG